MNLLLKRWLQSTVGKKSLLLFCLFFVMVASTSCGTGGGTAPTPETASGDVIAFHGPLQLLRIDLNDDGIVDDGIVRLQGQFWPGWASRPVGEHHQESLLFAFNHEINTSTLVSGRTFQLKFNGKVADGSFQFSPDSRFVVFTTDNSDEHFIHCEEGSLRVDIKIKGTRGPITDRNGNIWPFNGVYRVTEDESGPFEQPSIGFNNEDLLDGDRDGAPGGDFVKDFLIHIIC